MSLKPFLALEASAGSGKTFALSLRFCALILKGACVNEITALTFTKKAANEMKARVIKAFLNFEKSEVEAKELALLLEENGQLPSLEEMIAKRDARKSEFLQSNLHIHTFDSFFVKIIRAFCLHLGFLPDFKLANTLDTKNSFIYMLNKQELRKLASFLASLNESKAEFFASLDKLNSALIKKNHTEATYPDESFVFEYYNDFAKYAKTCLQDANFLKNFNATTLEELCKKPIICDINKKYFQSDKLDASFWEKRKGLLAVLDEYYNLLEDYRIKTYIGFLRQYEKARYVKNQKENILSFDDVTRYTYGLLNDGIDKDLIYFRLDASISHLLIDEFQDTNIFQYEILKPIIAELVSGVGVREGRSFFYVGDVKQSIYRFRGAKKELFAKLQSDFAQIENSSLDTNYRSKALIVDFVNKCFKDAMPKLYKEQKNVKKGGFIKVDTIAEGKNKEENLELFKPLILKNLEFLRQNHVNPSDICILCWKNEDANELRAFLKEQDIAAYTDSNLTLLNVALPRILYSYAIYLLFDDGFCLQLLKEYLGFKPKRLKLRLNDSPLNILLFLAKALRLDLSDLNLIAYLEYSCEFDDFLDLLFTPCQQAAVQSKELGICIMTVHKSKGLEFENLLVMDKFSSKKPNDETKLSIEYDDGEFELRIKDKARMYTQNKEYELYYKRQAVLDEEEELNKLYVAFTRAKSSLFILKRPKNGVFAPLNLDDIVLGELHPLTRSKSLEVQTKKQVLDTKALQIPSKRPDSTGEKYYFGLALHAFLENLDFFGDNYKLVQKIIANRYKSILADDELEDIYERTKKLLNHGLFLELIANKRLLKEQPLFYKGEKKIIDLLAIDENEAIIFDYKSSNESKKHEEQVSLYKRAILEIKGIKTRAFLVYLQKSSIGLKELF